ncbi:MAG: DUF2235 domain-containing protein [Dehalococcoidales bacterium]|nr:MAG: DUF2235 domain-containing protein [Dehalococcoidales bacterium]
MGKNIIICYDGTSNEYRENNTNVVRTFEAIIRDDRQIGFYDPGVGTLSIFGRRFGRLIGIALGLMFGYGIKRNIEDGYEYLMDTFEPGDRVFIFGFSRGAYTARALAGMVHQFGVLQKGSKNLIPYVSKMYFKKDKDKNFPLITGFKTTFSNECKVHLIGLWDTVGALGYNLSKRFTNLVLNPDIKFGFHAISVDEKRRPFKVVLWDEEDKVPGQVIEQAWFPGVHSEVGGGIPEKECLLPDLSFVWMMDKAAKGGLLLRDDWYQGLSSKADGDIHDSCTFFPWVLLGLRKKRKIIEGALVHQSVADRIDQRSDYRTKLPEVYTLVQTENYTNRS